MGRERAPLVVVSAATLLLTVWILRTPDPQAASYRRAPAVPRPSAVQSQTPALPDLESTCPYPDSLFEGYLAPWGGRFGRGIRYNMVAACPQWLLHCLPVVIRDGRLYSRPITRDGYPSRETSVLLLLLKLLQHPVWGRDFPDVQLLITLDDLPHSSRQAIPPVPVFGLSRAEHTFDIPIPFHEHVLHFRRLDTYLEQQPGGGTPWGNRSSRALWRGMTRGYSLKLIPRDRMPRLLLGRAAREHPDLLDVGWVAYYRDSPASLYGKDLERPSVHHSDWHRWKFQVHADGAGFSHAFVWKMLSGAVVRHWSPYRMFFDEQLEPGVHYVQTEMGWEDLPEQLRRLRANDTAAEQMFRLGRARMRELLSVDGELCYMSKLLRRYASLQRFQPLNLTSHAHYNLTNLRPHVDRFISPQTSRYAPLFSPLRD